MNDESDFDLRPEQWEALKALRKPYAGMPPSARLALGELIGLGLVSLHDHQPVMTESGRKALIRGSFRLLDAAA